MQGPPNLIVCTSAAPDTAMLLMQGGCWSLRGRRPGQQSVSPAHCVHPPCLLMLAGWGTVSDQCIQNLLRWGAIRATAAHSAGAENDLMRMTVCTLDFLCQVGGLLRRPRRQARGPLLGAAAAGLLYGR